MCKKLALAAIIIILLAIVASTTGNCAGILGVGVDIPVYSEQQSTETATGKIQTVASYCQKVVWQWDEAEGSYLGTFPVGIGVAFKVYPNVLANLPILAIAATDGELECKLEFSEKHGEWQSKTPGVTLLSRDENGRFYLPISLEASIDSDAHCLRFYALVQGAKRNDKEINLILFKIKWVSKSNTSTMVDTLRFKTEKWPEGVEKPSISYLADLLRRAGNGGNGLVFETLIANDGARASFRQEQTAEDSQPQKTEKSVTRGTYFLKSAKNGQLFNGQVWYRFYDRANPAGKPAGPYCGLLSMKDAIISESCDGIIKNFTYRVDYSFDGQNWLSKVYIPSVGCTIDLEVEK